MNWIEGGEEATKVLIDVLDKMCGIKVLFYDEQSTVVNSNGFWWILSDNGGEIAIQKINDGEAYTSIPTATHPRTNIGTVAYRISSVVHGREPNWQVDASELCPTDLSITFFNSA